MTIDNLVPFLIVAVIVISSVVSGLKKVKRGFDVVVEKQRAAEPERLAAVKAELARRGVTAPAGLQGLLSALETAAAQVPDASRPAAYAAQPAFAPQPAYTPPAPTPPAAPQRHARQQRPPQPDAVPAFAARTVDVPGLPGVPARAGAMRRTFAEAFGDPAHARNAVVLLEVLGPPVALR